MVCPSSMVRRDVRPTLIDRVTSARSPQAISSGMLRIPPVNLNKQAQDATVLLIREVLDRGITLSEVHFSNHALSLANYATSGLCGCLRSNEST